MQAVFVWKVYTGTTAAVEHASGEHLTFLADDSFGGDAADSPLSVPAAASTVNSYERWFGLKCTVAPDTACENFEIWGSSEQPDYDHKPPNKVTLYLGTTASAATPVVTNSTIATLAQHSSYYDSAHALTLNVEPGDNKIDAVDEYVRYGVAQLRLAEGVASGHMTTFILNITYDES